ncbi:MAG: Hsp70 family protein [Clostridiales bacterium]|nr:Hsp70 family protein [Clostridiales bacterium]
MKLGIDFGSTYSTVSAYNSAEDRVEALTLVEGESASIPSVVSIMKGEDEVSCGKAAKEQVGRSIFHTYEAFKMLLTETDQKVLRSRGYDRKHTPREISKCFLDSTLQGILNRYDDGKGLEKVCICVPEIWSKKLGTLDGRNILREILQELKVKDVQVVNEPEAASAFFAYNYEKTKKERFDGYLLLIDYGGGTLDITLTKVYPNEDGTMEIQWVDDRGEGENHPNARGEYTIGKAGIAYMQALAVRALRDCGKLDANKEPDYTSPAFLAFVRDLESQLKSAIRISAIEDKFGEYQEPAEILQEEPSKLCFLDYKGDAVRVTYQQLYEVYRDTIEGVVARKIGEINQIVKQHIHADPCDPASGARDKFKIALVGGFGSFYLVKKQIAEIYKLDANKGIDLRTQNIPTDKRELAISLGAALLAAEKVVLKKIAHYSIGVYTWGSDGEVRLRYGIKYHQVIEPNKPYFLCFDDNRADVPENRTVYNNMRKNIKNFAIEFTERRNHGGLMILKPEMRRRLAELPTYGLWNCGFSMDESEIVTFHIVPCLGTSGEERTIRLDCYEQMFEMTEVTEVTT